MCGIEYFPIIFIFDTNSASIEDSGHNNRREFGKCFNNLPLTVQREMIPGRTTEESVVNVEKYLNIDLCTIYSR